MVVDIETVTRMMMYKKQTYTSCHLLQATATALHTGYLQAQWCLSATREHIQGRLWKPPAAALDRW
eukprot:COSAG02_NODE_5101_length_4629_cov_36.514128_6_plen_66_part_00